MLRYLHLNDGDALPALDGSKPFKAVVVSEEAGSPEWQAEVSAWLVRARCLYVMAWGADASSWDDSIDVANLEANNWNGVPIKDRVWTTWHENDKLEEVFWFAEHIAHHDHAALEDTLILHIGGEPNEAAFRTRFAASV